MFLFVATGKYTITDKTIKLASGISIELVYGDLVTSQVGCSGLFYCKESGCREVTS